MIKLDNRVSFEIVRDFIFMPNRPALLHIHHMNISHTTTNLFKESRNCRAFPYLNVAVIVTGVAAIPRMDQDSVETIHHRVSDVLGHVGSDVQELWVTHVLGAEGRKASH